MSDKCDKLKVWYNAMNIYLKPKKNIKEYWSSLNCVCDVYCEVGQSKCHFLVLWNPAFKIVQSLEDIGSKKLAISCLSSQAVFSLLIIHCSLEIRSRNQDLFLLPTAWRLAVYLGQKTAILLSPTHLNCSPLLKIFP